MRALTVVAVTHHNAPFAILERVILDPDASDAVALALRARPGVEEAVVLSTCNRTELYLATDAPAIDRRVADDALDVLGAHTGVPGSRLRDVAFALTGDDVALHLFRVASGLESRVVGEGEILGQVRSAASRAHGHPASGPTLDTLFRWAAATGRRVRRASDGTAPPSLARTAIDAAGPMLPHDLTVVLGAGAMASAVTNELASRRLPYRVVARRPERAARLTRRPQDAVALEDLPGELRHAALVVCATGAREPIVTTAMVREARAGSGAVALKVVDLSMPRNVEAEVGDLEGVQVIHLEQLQGDAGELHLRRSTDAVAAEHARYQLWQAGQSAGPVIAALRDLVTDMCRREAERHVGPDAAAEFARRVAGKILHPPTLALKELGAQGDTAALEVFAAALGVEPRTPDEPPRAQAAS